MEKELDDKELTRYHLENQNGTLYYKDINHTRVPRLTLKHLNKLKKIQAVKDFELIKRQSIVQTMYAPKEEEGGGGPF